VTRLVSVVVPAYGHPDRLRRLIEALAAQVPGETPLTLIVSDDASPEPLEPSLRPHVPEGIALEVVRASANGGPGAARNRALELVRTPWTAFLDADELPGPDWLERLETIVRSPDAPDGVEGRLDAGAAGRPTPFTHVAEVHGGDDQHVAGNVLFRTEVLRSVGGFDERFYDPGRKLHFREDVDLYLRLERAGKRLEFDPELRAEHPPLPGSFWSPVRDARRYYFDPLLSREHGARFRRLVRLRRAGPVPLRWARGGRGRVVGTVVVAILGFVAGWTAVGAAGAIAAVVGLAANAFALAWNRRLTAASVLLLVPAAAIVPWVYLWHYYRGVLAFRHRPRLT
jgi:glycosyltransferase involved in cell wall biosynthesis